MKRRYQLKSILSEMFDKKIDSGQVMNSVREFARFGQVLNRNEEFISAAKNIVAVAESAQEHVLAETGDWFDKISVNRNMKQMNGIVKEFKKTVTENSAMNQRLLSLYEEMGMILNRYYDIGEAMDPVGKEDGDIDNDGDQDDSDEYLAKKRAAISKAVKNEAKNVVGLAPLQEFLPPTMKAQQQKLKNPKTGKEVTVGSVMNQGEKMYPPALVKKARAIYKQALDREAAARKKRGG